MCGKRLTAKFFNARQFDAIAERNCMKQNIKIVIAPDSFKGSISAHHAAAAIENGILEGLPNGITAETVKCPIADGGEGTLDALVNEHDRITLMVTGTNGAPVTASYGILGTTAVIEMASAAGLTLVEESCRNAASATTFGVGELIHDALDRGFRHILLTVGGSGTNDGGCGMLCALGATFLQKHGTAFIPTGGTLSQIDIIDLSALDSRLTDTRFTVATDVKNPLCGDTGATRVYARQKGADDATLEQMELGMCHYAQVLQNVCGKDIANMQGCGAGGGLAAPLLAFCNASIESGIHAVLKANHFADRIKNADLIITGEGKIDRQSLFGKAISGVAEAAKMQIIPVVCLVGCIGDDINVLKGMGITDILAISDLAPDTEYSIRHADILLSQLAKQYIQEWIPSSK